MSLLFYHCVLLFEPLLDKVGGIRRKLHVALLTQLPDISTTDNLGPMPFSADSCCKLNYVTQVWVRSHFLYTRNYPYNN